MPSGEHPNSAANLKPFQAGQSGNPEGRKTAGATAREWLNSLAEQQLTQEQVKTIARDLSQPLLKRAAAERMLRMIEAGDMADFEDVLNGETSLMKLRDSGVNTEIVKKIKQRLRRVETESGSETTIEREIELHDRAGSDFDRVVEQTDGRPAQAVKVDGSVAFKGVEFIVPGMTPTEPQE